MAVADTSRRQKGTKRVQTRAVARSDPITDMVKNTPDNRAAFAWVALDERGNVRIHASDKVKGYLDEMSLSNQFQQAYEQSRTGSGSDSRRGTMIVEEQDSDADDSMDHTMTAPVKSAAKSSSRRGLQPVKQRGRALAPRPRPASIHQTPPETPVESAAASPAECGYPLQEQRMSFRIDDADAVANFLVDRLKRLQQLADKKIAKAWIKGICPKKQAKFPYQNNRQEKETGVKPEIPVWWPEVDVCRFIEPDHIRREERMGLCLHLLRLRPTPAQLEEWNGHDTPASKTHRQSGWTAWLKELAGFAVFEDLPREPEYRTKYRKELMTQMYEAAQMEEDYLAGGIDGTESFEYKEYDDYSSRAFPAKRSRRPSTASTPEYEELTTRSVSSSCSRGPAKRARQDSRPSTAQKVERRGSDVETTDAQPGVPAIADHDITTSSFEGKIESVPGPSVPVASGDLSGFAAQPPHQSPVQPQYHVHGLPLQGNWRTFDHLDEWHGPNMPSHAEHQGGNHLSYQAPNTFPGRQTFVCPEYQQVQQPFMTHQCHVPQPEFQTVSNTPAFSSAGMASIPMDSYPMQPTSMAHLPAEQHYALSMTPAQFYTSPHADPTVADFRPPTTMGGHQYQQDGLAERHIASMQTLRTQGMMPLQQPVPWHQPQQQRHP